MVGGGRADGVSGGYRHLRPAGRPLRPPGGLVAARGDSVPDPARPPAPARPRSRDRLGSYEPIPGGAGEEAARPRGPAAPARRVREEELRSPQARPARAIVTGDAPYEPSAAPTFR